MSLARAHEATDYRDNSSRNQTRPSLRSQLSKPFSAQ
jgi:hypothetical protein